MSSLPWRSNSREFSRYFGKVNYSFANEDGHSEARALGLRQEDVVVCIAGSGARAFELLLGAPPRRLIAIDFNPSQVYLTQLKIAAIRALTYEEFAAFAGLMAPPRGFSRREVYRSLAASLPPQAQGFWAANAGAIDAGLLHCGTWERWLARLGRLPRSQGRVLRRMMACNSLQEQVALWQQHWNHRTWRWALRLLCQRRVWRTLMREPGIDCIPEDFDIADYLHEKVAAFMQSHLLRDSFFAQMLAFGSVREPGALPAHLLQENYATLRDNLACLEVHHASLQQFLQNHRDTPATAFSLSDFGSYTSIPVYTDIWGAVARFGAPGARVCERQFLVKLEPDKLLQACHGMRIVRDSALEAALQRQDNSVIYSFVCATLPGVS